MVHDQLAGLDPDRLVTLGVLDEGDDTILSLKAYEAICRMYWVSAWKNEHEPARPDMWCFSVHQPLRVGNPSMYWRRPTYEEALRRQGCYLDSVGIENRWWPGSDDYWDEYVVKGAGHFNIPGRPYR
jgi:hypothetical protein